MNKKKIIVGVLAVVLCVGLFLPMTQGLLINNVVSDKDAHVQSNVPDQNMGSNDDLLILGGSTKRRGFIYFDELASYTNYPYVVNKAYLNFTENVDYVSDAGVSVSFYNVTQSWGESTITWNNQPTVDATAQFTATTPNPFNNEAVWSIDVTSEVQEILNNDATDWYGWSMRMTNEGSADEVDLYSKEIATASKRPTLYVSFQEALTPNKPTLNAPTNGLTDVDPSSVTLNVTVTHPEAHNMTVKFYWNNDTLIETDTGVLNNTYTTATVTNLSYETTYQWYATATSETNSVSNTSDTWSFTTKNAPIHFESESPTDDATDVAFHDTEGVNCSVQINSTSGGTFAVVLQRKTDGGGYTAFKDFGTGLSNGTYAWNCTNFNEHNTEYYWRVVVTYNSTEFVDVYSFTTVANSKPNAVANVNATETYVDENLTFSQSSTDSDGSIANYSWNMGDGNTVYKSSSFNYSWDSSGIYTVNLTVTDDDNLTDYDTLTIYVFAKNPDNNVTDDDSEDETDESDDEGEGDTEDEGVAPSSSGEDYTYEKLGALAFLCIFGLMFIGGGKGGLKILGVLLILCAVVCGLYWYAWSYLTGMYDWAVGILTFAFLPFVGMARNPIIEFLDGRGQFEKKVGRLLILGIAVAIVYGIIAYGSPYATWFTNYFGGFLYLLIMVLGFWMVGNKHDNMTILGYGMFAVGLWLLLLYFV